VNKKSFLADFEMVACGALNNLGKNKGNVLHFQKKVLYLHPQLRQQAAEPGFTPA